MKPVVLLLISISSIVRAELPCDESLARVLKAQYEGYRESARTGNMTEYKRLRSKAQLVKMEDHLAKLNKSPQMADIIKRTEGVMRPASEYRLIRCDFVASKARLVFGMIPYLRNGETKKTIEHLIVMFEKEATIWKVGEIHLNFAEENSHFAKDLPDSIWKENPAFQLAN